MEVEEKEDIRKNWTPNSDVSFERGEQCLGQKVRMRVRLKRERMEIEPVQMMGAGKVGQQGGDYDLKRLRYDVQTMVISEDPEKDRSGSDSEMIFQNPFRDPNACYRVSIRVRTLTGRVIEIEVSLLDTVRDVKERILTREGIPIVNQRLVYNGRSISDSQILDTVGVKHRDIIFLVLGLRG